MTPDLPGRARTFGAAAAAYERYRPGYPERVGDLVLEAAPGEVRTALEIGAGTGKATRAFAARGIAVTATDPDGAMLGELSRSLPTVRTVEGALEDLGPIGPFDLVYAAASLHWTVPAGRWERVAALLRPGGLFASFGGPVRLADPAVESDVRAARAPYLDSDQVPSPDGTPEGDPLQWPGTELERSDLFTDVRQVVLPRSLQLVPDDYVGYLSTVSAYLSLDETDRTEVLRRVRGVLPAVVEVQADIVVHTAMRVVESSDTPCDPDPPVVRSSRR